MQLVSSPDIHKEVVNLLHTMYIYSLGIRLLRNQLLSFSLVPDNIELLSSPD